MKEEKPQLVKFIEKGPLNLKGFTLIEGFLGMGFVGTISAKYLAEKLGFREVGFIELAAFVPIIRVHNGLPVHPSRIYVNKKKKLVLLTSEQIIPQLFTKKLANAVVDWIKQKKIAKVVLLSGIRAMPSKEGKEIVYGIASDEFDKKILKKHKVQVIKEGITSGVTALVLLGLKDNKIEAFSLMGNIQIAADYKAASSILEKLSEILSLDLDTKPLKKEAKETKKALLEHLKQIKQNQVETTKFEADQTPMYS